MRRNKYIFFTLCFLTASLFICNSCKDSQEPQQADADLFNIDIDSSAVYLRYETTMFSLPSPHQVSLLMAMDNMEFDASLLNNPDNYTNYSTTLKKALNLGIYGTDLGYLNIYNRFQEAINYYMVVEKLANSLELGEAINERTMEKIEANLGHNDSLLQIISNTYQDIDSYLTINNREAVGVLVLAGGWLESTFILSQYLLEQHSESQVEQLSKQKYPLEKLIRLMAPFYDKSEQFANLIDQFTDLAYEFDCIDINYHYQPPTTYPELQMTMINSQTRLNLNNYNLAKIANKIKKIRQSIIQ
ncbi:MAG: hypothetical protein ACOC2F_08655 [Bacteroidota bacterium]